MEIVNGARHTLADTTVALDKTGREHLVIVAKATYRIPANNKVPRAQIPPQPLVFSDIFVGEPGLSAPLYEVDFVRYKSKCDVLFNAQAHAPQGRPVEEMRIGVKVGPMEKMLRVVGHRRWGKGLPISSSKPKPFTEMPLNYGHAFGGTQHYTKGKKAMVDTFEKNPVGTGYMGKSVLWNNSALPNLEAFNRSITNPAFLYEPIALSAVARNWLPRRKYAGTYDEHWEKEIFPFLPEDFDERFFQCAPPDQQIDYPQGGEDVVLVNMMKGREEVRFKLPRLDNLPVKILTNDYQVHTPPMVVDTLYFEPDEERFSVVWRTSLPIKRRIQEFQTVAIGHVCKEWWEAKAIGASGCSGCGGQQHSTDSAPGDCPNAQEEAEA